jgi:putative membrane protein
MKKASTYFDDDGRQQIENAVREAESKTSCEIVPVVATASGRYDRAEDIVGLWFAMIVAVLVWFFIPFRQETGSWGQTPVYVGIITLIVGCIAAFIAGALIASQIRWLRRLFTPNVQMREEVSQRARQVFFDQRVHHAGHSSGVLIYISLYEHQAVVLADRNVLDTVGQQFLDDICHRLTDSLQKDAIEIAIQSAVQYAGEKLSEQFPASAVPANELSDALVLIDQC